LEKIMKFLTVCLCCSSLLLSGCTAKNAFTRKTEISYASIGALACGGTGALIGALAGESAGTSAVGALSGVALCGGIGYYFDLQEEKLRKKLESTGVSVIREGKSIRLVMPGNILFTSDSARLSRPFHDVLDSIEDVLTEYDKTGVYVQGYTDSSGSESHNLKLSKNRADAVADYLVFKGVKKNRILVHGFGEQRPISSNLTDKGRGLNRRVEILVKPK
jgi:outer membrane protein OmpA-like peptidoglycan-associated protein